MLIFNWRLVFPVSVALLLMGCAAALEGTPEPVVDTDAQLQALRKFTDDSKLDAYINETDLNQKKAKRNEYLDARMAEYDLQYFVFEKSLFREGVGASVLTSWLKLALGGAGALYEGASQALSAASAGIEGAKSAFDKEAFFENTLPTLISSMRANRKTLRLRLRRRMLRPVTEYSLPEGLSDLFDYRDAGTVAGALASISQASGAQAEEADKQILATFGEDKATELLESWMGWDSDTKQFANPANVTALRKWLDGEGLQNVFIPTFLSGAEYSNKRLKAIGDLIK